MFTNILHTPALFFPSASSRANWGVMAYCFPVGLSLEEVLKAIRRWTNARSNRVIISVIGTRTETLQQSGLELKGEWGLIIAQKATVGLNRRASKAVPFGLLDLLLLFSQNPLYLSQQPHQLLVKIGFL